MEYRDGQYQHVESMEQRSDTTKNRMCLGDL